MDHVQPPSELVKELSAEGEEHLDAMLSISMTPEEWVKKLLLLPPKDQKILWQIHRHRSMGDRHENERFEEDFAQRKRAELDSNKHVISEVPIEEAGVEGSQPFAHQVVHQNPEGTPRPILASDSD